MLKVATSCALVTVKCCKQNRPVEIGREGGTVDNSCHVTQKAENFTEFQVK